MIVVLTVAVFFFERNGFEDFFKKERFLSLKTVGLHTFPYLISLKIKILRLCRVM